MEEDIFDYANLSEAESIVMETFVNRHELRDDQTAAREYFTSGMNMVPPAWDTYYPVDALEWANSRFVLAEQAYRKRGWEPFPWQCFWRIRFPEQMQGYGPKRVKAVRLKEQPPTSTDTSWSADCGDLTGSTTLRVRQKVAIRPLPPGSDRQTHWAATLSHGFEWRMRRVCRFVREGKHVELDLCGLSTNYQDLCQIEAYYYAVRGAVTPTRAMQAYLEGQLLESEQPMRELFEQAHGPVDGYVCLADRPFEDVVDELYSAMKEFVPPVAAGKTAGV